MTTGLNQPSNYYIQLVTTFPPRPITSKAELDLTQAQIDALLDRGQLTQDDRDFLNVLGTLVYDYEQKHEPSYSLGGIKLLTALMAEENLQPSDLVPPFEDVAIANAVLSGTQSLTIKHIQGLAQRFQLTPILFFEQ